MVKHVNCASLRRELSMSHVFHNTHALKELSLIHFCDVIPSFAHILQRLQKNGFSLQQKTIAFEMKNFLVKFSFKPTFCYFHYSPAQLIAESLNLNRYDTPTASATNQTMQDPLNCYIHGLCDLLKNRLAQRNYDSALPNHENVSERAHALQAGKIAFLLGMDREDILAMLFHDIARMTHADTDYGDKHHSEEGSIILSPLSLTVDFSKYHTFAKYLLNEFCPLYQTLISPVSRSSLSIQTEHFKIYIDPLNQLNSVQLSLFIYKIMLMRLIDDMSKVPSLLLKETTNEPIEYFNDEVIHRLVRKQFILSQCQWGVLAANEFEKKVERALSLIQRRTKDTI